jgi:hypothetical protein
VVDELATERAMQAEIVGQRLVERAHAASPGHGAANLRSATKSTFA